MLHGYSARHRKSGEEARDSVAEPVSLGAFALAGDPDTVLFLTLDTIGVHSHEVLRMRAAVEKATGIPRANVVVCGSHTHFAPSVSTASFTSPEHGIADPDPRYVAHVMTAAVEAATESTRDMQEATPETYRVRAPSVLFNRRTLNADGKVETNFLYPEDAGAYTFSPVDDELAVLRVTTTTTGPRGVLMNFGCHPVTGGRTAEEDFYSISADYPWHARDTIRGEWGCPVFFSLGAAGDAVPRNRMGTCRRQIGSVLGNSVVLGERVFSDADPGQERCRVEVRTEHLEVATIIETAEDAQAEYEKARAALRAAGDDAPQARERFSEAALHAFRRSLYPTNRYSIEVQFIRVGETVFVALPFEVLSEFAIRMKQEFPGSVLLSVANGYQGYLPFAYEYERGGYEASPQSTHFEIGTTDRLYELVRSVLCELHG